MRKFITPDARGATCSLENNDCTVRALTNAHPDMSYWVAHGLLEKAGRVRGQAVASPVWMPVYIAARFCPVATFGTTKGALITKALIEKAAGKGAVPHNSGVTIANLLPTLNKNKRYIVKIRGHVFAVVEGMVIDKGVTKAEASVQAVFEYVPEIV